jgi:hypothetical protein
VITVTQVETLSPDPSLTGGNTQENKGGSVEPAKDEVSLEDKGFQAALQKKAELLKAKEAELEEAKRKIRGIEDQEKQRKLADMSEVDRYKSVAEDEARRRGEIEMKFIVAEALLGKNIPTSIAELIRESPWAIPPVKRELGSDFTWDDAIESVRRHLPEYINSLVVDSPTKSEEEPQKKVDSERSVETYVSSGHVYTQREVAEISRDPKEYEKHRPAIMKQLEKNGGRLPEY